jgi:hypothetical protein
LVISAQAIATEIICRLVIVTINRAQILWFTKANVEENCSYEGWLILIKKGVKRYFYLKNRQKRLFLSFFLYNAEKSFLKNSGEGIEVKAVD